MLIEHRGRRPQVDPTAWVAPTAVVSGAVTIGAGARVLHGAILSAEGRAEMAIGPECVIMEHAVLRASGRFPLRLGDRVLVGPHAYLVGCTIGARSFIATGAMVFNGAVLGEACVVALGGKVHIATVLAEDARVPMGFIAFGDPGRIYAPEQAPAVHEEIERISFMRYVFGVETDGRSRAEIMEEAMEKYARALGAHAEDRIVDP